MSKKLEDLKEALVKELEDYAEGGVDVKNLSIVDKLAHAAKNVCKVMDYCEGDYSERSYRSYDDRSYNDRSYDDYDGASRRRSMNSYRRGRDSMGRYTSRDDGMVEKLRELMEEADGQTRVDLQRMIQKMEK